MKVLTLFMTSTFASSDDFFCAKFMLNEQMFLCFVTRKPKCPSTVVPHSQDPDERGGQLRGHPAHDAAAAEAGEQAGGQAGQEVDELDQPPLRLGRQQHQRALQRICSTHTQ